MAGADPSLSARTGYQPTKGKLMNTKHLLCVAAITVAACSHERSEPKSPPAMTPASGSEPSTTGREYETPPATTPLSPGDERLPAGADTNPPAETSPSDTGAPAPAEPDEIRGPNSEPHPLAGGTGGTGGSGGMGGSSGKGGRGGTSAK